MSLLTTAEVAAALGLTEGLVRQLTIAGRIPEETPASVP